MGISYAYSHRIGWGECDSAGIVHYPYFYRWFDQGMHELMRKAGFSDRDIWDIAAVAGFFNMSNRIASATDMRPNAVYHAQGR